jgi:hypothetical protein
MKIKILLLTSIFPLLTCCSGGTYYESADNLNMFSYTYHSNTSFKAKAEKVFYAMNTWLNFNIPEDTTFTQFKDNFIKDNNINSFADINEDYHYFTTKDSSNKLDYYIIENDHTSKFCTAYIYSFNFAHQDIYTPFAFHLLSKESINDVYNLDYHTSLNEKGFSFKTEKTISERDKFYKEISYKTNYIIQDNKLIFSSDKDKVIIEINGDNSRMYPVVD